MSNCPIQSKKTNGSKTTCNNCRKRQISLFDELSYNELTALDKKRFVIKYNQGELIYKKGSKPSGVLCLSVGKVKIVDSGINGEEQIISLKKPVDFIGLSDLVQDEYHTASAVAMEDCSVCVIPSEVFFDILHKNGTFSLKVIRYFANRLDLAKRRTEKLTQKHMIARMADTLILLYETFGNTNNDKSLKVQLKRSELASLSNMTTSNASRILSDLSKSKVIKVEQRKIKILQLDKLFNISLRG